MNIKENIRIAVFSIRSNMMRALLTMLGIIIGVAAVIAIITLGNGGRDYIVGMIREMGQSVVSVSTSRFAEPADYITLADVEELKGIDGVRYVSPFVMDMGTANTEYAKNKPAMILAGTPDLQQAGGATMLHGRFFSKEEFDAATPVCVIDELTSNMLFGYKSAVGETITITKQGGASVRVRVIGIANMKMLGDDEMRAQTEAMGDMMGGMAMGSAIGMSVPLTLLDRMTGNVYGYNTVYIVAEDEKLLDQIAPLAQNVLYARHGNGDAENEIYKAVNMATMINLLDSVIKIFTTFIAAVSAISLLVGGIGVMNIMLVSVTERTREIGIRKALGAKTRTILFQFLTESVILCVIGGLIGLALGVGGASAVASYLAIPIKLQGATVAIAVGFSSAIGMFFGIYPASRAAKMHPIEALRRE
ncbi:MAG: ABC transporter permease [Oscillospiraceae bacterium]|jgi:putative ABC transport system permease protein|nr:ABC transporter permease [Oscillospiraceae bacterium]